MRDDVIESVLIGSSAALLALAVHAWTAELAGSVQALALLLAGVVLIVAQLIFSARRKRQQRPPDPDEQAAGMLGPPRQNLFLRELNSDWTGLDAPQPARNGAEETAAEEAESAITEAPPAEQDRSWNSRPQEKRGQNGSATEHTE